MTEIPYFDEDTIVIPTNVDDARYAICQFKAVARLNGAYSLDCETTGLSWNNDRLLMVALYTPGATVVIPLEWPEINISTANIRDILLPLTKDKKLRCYLHNAKFDCHHLFNYGVFLFNEIHDTCVAGFDLDVTKAAKLKIRAKEELGIEMIEFKEKFKIGGKAKLTLLDYPAKEVAKYAALDVFATYSLADKYFSPTAAEDDYKNSVYLNNEDSDIPMLYDRIDSRIVPVLFGMERAGIRVDVPKLVAARDTYTAELEELSKSILVEAGVAFNMNSPKQVTQVFSRRGIALKSTDEKHLSAVSKRGDKLAKLMMEYRTNSKILSTYISTMLEHKDAQDRIHTNFSIHIASTGRLSSGQPCNLQNQPNAKWWREMFIPAEGHLLVVKDYSQIELRMLAVVSEDPVLLEEYRRGVDVHMNNGKLIAATLGIQWDKLTDKEKKEYRTWSKQTLGFGVIYGMGSRSLSEQLGVDESVAENLIETVFNKYKVVDRWIKRIKQSGLKTGYSKTPFGRRRDIPNLFSKDKAKLSYGLRQLVNAIIQGGAGDFMKLGMLEVANNAEFKKLGCRLLLTVHDELCAEAPAEHAERCDEIMTHCMSKFSAARKMPIEFPTDGGVGANWWAAKEGKG